MALCVYGDAGWGREVQRGRVVDRAFSRDLVDASAKAIQDRWRPAPAPTWVTAVPSGRRPGMVEDFARALAARLGLPFVEVFVLPDGDAQPQGAMQNSAQQLSNAHARLAIQAAAPVVDAGPVLLVDDMVDSGWTLTVAGWLLRNHGSGEVHPYALAAATAREG